MNLANEQHNTIIHELGIEQASSSVQEEVIEKIESLIQERVAVEVLSQLSEEDGECLKDIIETGSQEELNTFLKKSVIDIISIVERISQEVIEEYKKYKNQ